MWNFRLFPTGAENYLGIVTEGSVDSVPVLEASLGTVDRLEGSVDLETLEGLTSIPGTIADIMITEQLEGNNVC